MDVVKISLEALLQRATNPQNENIDTAAVEAFCALVSKEKEAPLHAVKLLAARMHSKNEQEALQTLHILDYGMQKCGACMQDEVGKFRFLNEMIKLVSPKYLGCHTPLAVKQKVLQLMYLWTLDYPKQTKIKDAYDMLKKQGVIKDVPLSVSADYTLARQQHNTIFQDDEKGKLLKKLLQSKNPEDLQAANRLIKTMVKEDEKKAELNSRRISELESVQNNVRLLNEMLDSYRRGVSSTDEIELIKELHESCVRMRPNVVRLASETQPHDEMLSEVLKVNDELGHVFDKYRLMTTAGDVIHGGAQALLDLNFDAVKKAECKSNVDMLCDILTTPLGDVLGCLDADAGDTAILKPTAAEDVKRANGDGNKKAFDDLDTLGESLMLANLQSTARIGTQFNKTEKIPMNLMACKMVPPPSSGLSKLTQPEANEAELTEECRLAKSIKTLNLDAELTNLLLAASKGSSPAIEVNQSEGASALDDLLVDITTTPTPTPTMTPTLSRTISSSSSNGGTITLCAQQQPASVDKDEEKENLQNGDGANVVKSPPKLSELFVDLKSIRPGSAQPIVALDERNGVTLTVHFGRDRPHDDVAVFVVSIVSKNELPLKSVLFRAIVPKSCKVKLQPPSASELPGYNPFLPAAAITQVMLIANPEKVHVSLKFIVSYIADDETMTEMGEIDELAT